MPLDRRGFLSASASALALGKAGLSLPGLESEPDTSPPPEPQALAAREITVYTTADKTDLRLTVTGKLALTPMGQPLESQVCVFVDPTKRGQTILGIGGALTDVGIDDAFMKEAAQNLQSGNAALFLLIRKMTTDKVLAALQGVGGTVMRTSFDHTKEDALRQALAAHTAANPAS